MKKIVILLVFSCNVLYAFGSIYYVDNNKGDDIFDGKSPAKAWKTLIKVNKHTFMPGDSVLFRRGAIWEGQLAPLGSGSEKQPVVFSTYGAGALPEIKAGGYFRDGILLKNIQYLVIEYIAVSNLDSSVPYQKNGPTGVRILSDNAGTLHNIRLANLYIHDINGDNKKGTNEGCGIFWDCQGPTPSNIEHLTIEHCKLERIDRNGIRGNGTFGIRSNWFPNKYLVIRNCIMDDIGGDGIVIKAFDNALVEHNRLFNIRTRAKDNAVAIWPHSSDNTTIQYNEVAYTRNGNWANDGQSFDIDGNCRNTIIQYNYSHDNEGGFMLVISDAINKDNVMTKHNIIRYNLSVNDGLNRKRLFNFAGMTDSTIIKGNVFYNDAVKYYTIEVTDIEGGIATNVVFEDNYFSYTGKTPALFTRSPKQYGQFFFNNNYFGGFVLGLDNLPNRKDKVGVYNQPKIKKPLKVSFPWMYLPARLNNQTGLFPESLYRSYYGKD